MRVVLSLSSSRPLVMTFLLLLGIIPQHLAL